MKFPLAAHPFPPLSLSRGDERKLEAAAESVVKKTLAQYHEHLTAHKGVVDEARWKKIKQREDVRVYRERRPSLDETASSSSSEDASADNGGSGSNEVVSPMLTFGTIQGKLDDVMYGVLNPSTDEMQLKTTYCGDGFEDWGVLATVIKPSEQNPFRELAVKWAVKGHLSKLVGAVMRVRDVVYLESTGYAKTPNGERIGYHLRHSVELPEIRELPECQLVRAKISFCHIFRQRRENCVELFIRGFASPMGDATVSLAAAMSAEVSVSDWKNVHCAEMKKLTRMLRAAQAARRSDAHTHAFASSSASNSSLASGSSTSAVSSTSGSGSLCPLCAQSLSGGGALSSFTSSSREKQCGICATSVCARCCVQKTLYMPTPQEKALNPVTMAVCTRCVLSASSASSTAFAVLDALAAEGRSVDYLEALVATS